VKKIFGTQDVVDRPYGTVLTGAQGEQAWGLDLSWKRFGPGRTLGGEGSGAETRRQRPTGLTLAVMVTVGFIVVCACLGFWFVLNGAPSPQDWFSGSKSPVEGGELVGDGVRGPV